MCVCVFFLATNSVVVPEECDTSALLAIVRKYRARSRNRLRLVVRDGSGVACDIAHMDRHAGPELATVADSSVVHASNVECLSRMLVIFRKKRGFKAHVGLVLLDDGGTLQVRVCCVLQHASGFVRVSSHDESVHSEMVDWFRELQTPASLAAGMELHLPSPMFADMTACIARHQRPSRLDAGVDGDTSSSSSSDDGPYITTTRSRAVVVRSRLAAAMRQGLL